MRIRNRNIGLCLVAAAFLVGAVACQPPAPAPAPAPPPDHAAKLSPAVNTLFEVWNEKRYEDLDGVFATDFRRIAPDANASGVEEFKEFMRQAHATYPDFHIVADDVHYLENLAILQWTVTGSVEGTPVKVEGATFLTFADGKILEERVYYDTAGLAAQAGTTKAPHVK